MRAGLIGRTDDLSRVGALLDRARAGTTQVLFIRGEPGIGKTRLLEEALAEAERLRFRTMVGHADDLDRGLPFAALRLAVGPSLRAEGGPRRAELAQELEQALHLASFSPDDVGTPATYELLYRMLTEWESVAPVFLAVDDLHSADEDTVAAFSFLIRHLRGRIVLAATLRAHPPDVDLDVASLVERLAAGSSTTLIDLDSFSPDEIAALVSEQTGGEPSPSIVDRIWTSTQGNPFFTVELLRTLHDLEFMWVDDGVVQLSPHAPMSASATTTVLHRIFHLGPATRLVAQACAVLTHVRLDDLPWMATAIGQSDDAVAEAFDTLVRANVLQGGDGFRFAHPIVRNTIYDDLGPAGRRRMHASYAHWRLGLRDGGHAGDVVDVARHLRQAVSGSDAVAARVFLEAGDVTLQQAPRSAAGWYADALRAIDLDDDARGAVLAKLARAHLLASNMPEAASIGAEALALLDPGELRARTVERCVVALRTSGQYEDALELVDRYRDEPDVSLARLLAQRAQVLLWLDRIAEACDDIDQARRVAGPAGEHLIEGVWLNLLWTVGSAADARALAAEMWERLPGYPPIRRDGALIAIASAAVYNGEPADAGRAFAQLGDTGMLPGAAKTALVHEAMHVGRWDEAIEIAAAAEDDLESGDRSFLPLMWSALAHIRAERGDVHDVERLRERMLASPVFSTIQLSGVAHLDMAIGEYDSARARLRRALDRGRRVGRYAQIPHTGLLLVDVELMAGRPEAAEAVCASLDDIDLDRLGARSQACVHLTRALARGDRAAATAAADVASRHGLVFEEARALQMAGSLGDDPDQLVAAAETYRHLRVRVRERDVLKELRRLGRRMPRAARDGSLTETECQLAQLVGEGLTNKQIATTMHLSPKTIEVYLTRLYAKVGCSSRVELAVALNSGRLDV